MIYYLTDIHIFFLQLLFLRERMKWKKKELIKEHELRDMLICILSHGHMMKKVPSCRSFVELPTSRMVINPVKCYSFAFSSITSCSELKLALLERM